MPGSTEAVAPHGVICQSRVAGHLAGAQDSIKTAHHLPHHGQDYSLLFPTLSANLHSPAGHSHCCGKCSLFPHVDEKWRNKTDDEKVKEKPGSVAQGYHLRHSEDGEFKASLDNLLRPCLKK